MSLTTPSEIDQAQLLEVKFPNLGNNDVIIPGTADLSFNIELSSTTDLNRTLVSNIGRAIVKQLAVKFEGNEIMSIDDYDIFTCYQDLWKTKSEKRNAIWQGIISIDLNIIHEENDITEMGELARVKAQLKWGKHTCLIMRMEHPRAYKIR